MRTVKVRTTQNIDLEYAIAGLGPRILAGLIDSILFLALYAVTFLIFTSLVGEGLGRLGDTIFLIVAGLYAFLFVFYNLLCEIFMNGQSIGKRIMDIRVVRLDGAQPTLGNYLVRWVLRLIDCIFTSYGLAIVLIAATEKGQRLGDMAAGTTVVSLKKQPVFAETIFESFEEDYEVKYPEVRQLTDKDIQLIKDVLNESKHVENTNIIMTLAKKLEDTLEVKSQQAPKLFVKTLLKDYNYLNSDF